MHDVYIYIYYSLFFEKMHDAYIVNGIARVLMLITKIVGSKFGL